jgi:hypothetical protein
MARRSNRQGFRDAAAILPFAAALLLMPPLIRIFATPSVPGAVPPIVLYIFAVWAAIILVALFVARRVGDATDDPEDTPGPGGT